MNIPKYLAKNLPRYIPYDDCDHTLFYCLENDKLYIIKGLPSIKTWEKIAEQIYPLKGQYNTSFNTLDRSVHLYAGAGMLCDDILYDTHISKGPFSCININFKDKKIPIFDSKGTKIGYTKKSSELEQFKTVFEYKNIKVGTDWLDAVNNAIDKTSGVFQSDVDEIDDEYDKCDNFPDKECDCDYCSDICCSYYDNKDMFKIKKLLKKKKYIQAVKMMHSLDTSPRECLWGKIPANIQYKYPI
jgi:hypothetical protein